MPQRITALTESQIIADIRTELRRRRNAGVAVTNEIGEYQEFTAASGTLTYLPSSSFIPLVALNGLAGRYNTDYTVDFTSGAVSWSAGFTSGDVLSVWYQTNGELIAASAPADTGSIVDNFNRANTSTSMGTTSDGQAVWSNLIGAFNVVSNQAQATALAGTNLWAVAVVTGSVNGTVQATLQGGMTTGLVFRAQDANNFWIFMQGNSGNSSLKKVVAGAVTTVLNVTQTNAVGDVFKVTFSGSSITCYHNGTSIITATDSTLASAVSVGLLGSVQNSSTWDDFSFLPS